MSDKKIPAFCFEFGGGANIVTRDMAGKRCGACGKSLKSGDKIVVFDGQNFHRRCAGKRREK